MTDTNNAPLPEEKKAEPAQAEGDLRAELARIRNKNRTLKIVAAILFSMFLIIAAGGYYIYRKVSTAIAPFQDAFQGFAPVAAGYQPENRTLPLAQGVYSSTSMPASTLGLFSGGLPGGSPQEAFDPEQGERLLKAMNKYADRPIVKEFLADLKKNPEIAAAFSSPKGVNPAAFMAAMQNVRGKGMEKMMMKYAARPEFLKLMMEFMNDPELKPLLRSMPSGAGIPGMPQGAVSVPSGPPPAESRPSVEEGDGEMTFDPAVISGPAKKAPAPVKKVPVPVDND
ncbi:MAG: hypothetical protein Q8O90_04305 [Elusimicrobiota bacterium]|nr:hypothetical protein [Elusimicrobiota bacterium]